MQRIIAIIAVAIVKLALTVPVYNAMADIIYKIIYVSSALVFVMIVLMLQIVLLVEEDIFTL